MPLGFSLLGWMHEYHNTGWCIKKWLVCWVKPHICSRISTGINNIILHRNTQQRWSVIITLVNKALTQWRTLGGARGGDRPPNNFSWSFHFEKWKHKEVFILRKGSTMTTTNNQHNSTKWHCLKTNKKQYYKFLIFWRSMPPNPHRRLVPSAFVPPIFHEVSATALTSC